MDEQQHYFNDTIQKLEQYQEQLSEDRNRAKEHQQQCDNVVRRITIELDQAVAKRQIAKDNWDKLNNAMAKNYEAISALKSQGSSTPSKEAF